MLFFKWLFSSKKEEYKYEEEPIEYNSYSARHNEILQKRREYQEYLEECLKIDQPFVLKEEEFLDEYDVLKGYTFDKENNIK